jgi:pimeloyl-ACP methyl ester carboxylesterase
MLLWHEIKGTGSDVVLLHSGVTDSGEWDDMLPLLAQRHRVLRLDHTGWGQSPLPAGPFSWADDVRATLDAAGMERPAIVGTSFGSRIALEIAERAAALVLISPPPLNNDWSAENKALDAKEDELLEAGAVDEAADMMVRAWVDGPERGADEVDASLRARVHAMQKRTYELYLATPDAGPPQRDDVAAEQITVPTLVVRGALDYDDVARGARELCSAIPDAREIVIDGVAHLPTMERPDEVARVVGEFLASLPGANRRK